jgi:chromosome segregation ATPase
MVVSVKEFIEESGVLEEVEDELSGIKNLNWDITTYADNLNIINNTIHSFFVHISEHLKRIEDLREEIKKVEEMASKEAGDSSADPWYQLYQSQKAIENFWFRIVGYLSLQLDVLDKANSKLAGLLSEARRYGILKQRVETELETLKALKESFMETLTKMREHLFEVDKRVGEVLSQIITATQQKVDLTPIMQRIEKLEEEIEEIKVGREERVERVEMEEEKPKKLSGIALTNAIENLVKNEGITDRVEIARRLGVSPMQVSMAGYKNILAKYSKVESEEEEEEESE